MCVLAEATPILNICYRIVIDPSGAVAVQLEVCVLAEATSVYTFVLELSQIFQELCQCS